MINQNNKRVNYEDEQFALSTHHEHIMRNANYEEMQMPINAHPEYLQAEKEYLQAQTPEEKIECLEKMISTMPGHKGAENLRQQLTQRMI